MITVACQQCGTEFETVPARIKDGRGKFCSRKCYELSKCRVEIRTCPTCGKTYETRPSDKKIRCSKQCFYRSRRTIVSSRCKWCDKEFEHHEARAARFCSIECHHEWQRAEGRANRETRVCPHCSKTFWRKPSDSSTYCSVKCALAARSTKVPAHCTTCGKEFMVKQSKMKTRKSGRLFCGRDCYAAWRKTLVGEKAYPWKGGKSFEPYCHHFNGRFKKRIRERDGYICAICRRFGRAVHHIDYDKTNTTPLNCITLCRPCHAATGGSRTYWENALTRLMQARGHIEVGATRS